MTVQVKGIEGFQSKIGKFAQNAPQADRKIVTGIAAQSKTIILATAKPNRLSRFANGRGINLKVNYRIREDAPISAVVLPTPPGPWYLLEAGGKQHAIGKRGARRGARRGQPGFLGNRAGGFAAVGPVQHPGSPAQHTWSNAVAPAVANGQRLYRSQAAKTYLSMF